MGRHSGIALNFCSAFVVPNHPVLTGVLSRASSILKEWSGNSSLDAYQSCNPNRVKLQLAALYEAIKSSILHTARLRPVLVMPVSESGFRIMYFPVN